MAITVSGNIGIADTYAEITGYGSPTEGLIVFCKANGLHYRYNSSAWAQFTTGSFFTSNNVPAASVSQSSTHRLVSDSEKSTWNGKEEGGAAADALASAQSYADALASALDGAKLDNPTGTPTGSKFLRDDNTWQTPPGGSFSGTMDDIDDGVDFVKTENNYTDADAAIVGGVTAALAGKAPALGTDDNYVTDAEKTKLSNLSGTNTGDQDLSGKSDVGHGHAISDVTGLQTALDGKAAALGADDNYVTDAEKVVIGNTSGTNSGDNAVNTLYSGLAASKQDVLTNGYGLSGTTTKAVSLTSSSAFATAETTISAATYADIAGASISLAAGTWMVIGQVNARAVNAIIQCFVAITDGANAVVSEIAMSRPASGTASLNSPISCNVVAIVSPVGTTTYKLRGARGLTTHTGSWIAMDGNGLNTTNHASNNTDKGTGIFAIRIA